MRTILTLLVVLLAKVTIYIFAECRRADADAYRQSSVDL